MNTVRNFYKKDCENVTPECLCTPTLGEDMKNVECSFASDELITDFDTKMRVLKDYGYKFPVSAGLENDGEEALDFIQEFPVYIIRAGKVLCHSASTSKILRFSLSGKEKRSFSYYPNLGWWNEFFVGHSDYNGGWFTYETNYGGPKFGLLLYYRVIKDIPVLFVPNYRVLKNNPEYFSKEDALDPDFTGSHIVRGVKGWKQKKYPKITPKYYADEFAQRLIKLGFPGYISCDECEVFVSHKSMQKSLYERPYRIVYEHSLFLKCSKCGEKNFPENEKCSNCENAIPTQPAKEEVRTIFHMMVDALCPADTKCPLKINEGNRNVIDLQVPLTKEIMNKVLPTEEFLREYSKISPSFSNDMFQES